MLRYLGDPSVQAAQEARRASERVGRRRALPMEGLAATTSALNNIANSGGTGTAYSTANETQLSQALANIVAGAIKPEVCDNTDNNCNGCTDEGFAHYCDVQPVAADCCATNLPSPPNPTPAWYKLLWLRKHEPETLKRTAHVVDVAGYLIQKLTGEWATSWACADPLGLVDLQRFDYDDKLLEQAGLDRSKVSKLLPPGAVAGPVLPEIARELGLPQGLPVVVGAGDGQSAGLGCNVTRPGRAYLNIGTGTVSGVYAESYSHAMAYRTMGGPVPGTYILETFIGGGTQNIVWFVEQLAGIDAKSLKPGETPEQVLERMAADVPEGAGQLLCLPYWTGAMTPYWDGHARGAFVGLSGLHGKGHMYRAILEAIALEERLLTTGVESATGRLLDEIVLLGGGARSPLWCQIIANVLGRTVRLAREQESTALGAGIHAAAAAGLFPGLREAADAMTGVSKSFTPDQTSHDRYSGIFEAYRSIYPGLKTTFRLISEKTP